LKEDFESHLGYPGYKSHLHFWIANGCRWKHETDKVPRRPLPEIIHKVRLNRTTKKLTSVGTIPVPPHFKKWYAEGCVNR
jgi:hypothetical protein